MRPIRLRVIFNSYQEPTILNIKTCQKDSEKFKKLGFKNPRILFKLGARWLDEYSRENPDKVVGLYKVKEENDFIVLRHVDKLAEIILPSGYVNFYFEQTSRKDVAICLTAGHGFDIDFLYDDI